MLNSSKQFGLRRLSRPDPNSVCPRSLLLLALLALLAAALLASCTSGGSPDSNGDATSSSAAVSVQTDEILSLGLNGRLILIRFVDGTPALYSLDLATAELDPLFQPPPGAWITAAAASSVTGQIALAYSPAPEQGQSQRGFTGISLLPLSGEAEPTPFIQSVDEELLYSFPEWAPDGSAIYFNEFRFGEDAGGGDVPVIGRQAYPQGAPDLVVESGQWPRLAWDGRTMVYIGVSSSAENPEVLQTIDLTSPAAEPVEVPVGPEIEVLDVPMFSPDGSLVYFSAPTPHDADHEDGGWGSPRTAQAHDVSSEWWRVPAAGGVAERLTDVEQTDMYGEFSPDGRHMAFISATGVFVMNPDGSGLQTLIEGEGFFGSIDWVD